MRIETSFRKQKAVLWKRVSTDRNGQPIVASPIEIKVRWQETHKDTLMPDGTVLTFTDTVVTDIDIPEGSILWKGSITDYTNRADASLREVYSFRKSPDLKGRRYRRVCILIRTSNTLPTIET